MANDGIEKITGIQKCGPSNSYSQGLGTQEAIFATYPHQRTNRLTYILAERPVTA